MSADPFGEPVRCTNDGVLGRLAAIDHRLHQISIQFTTRVKLPSQLDEICANLETLIRSLKVGRSIVNAQLLAGTTPSGPSGTRSTADGDTHRGLLRRNGTVKPVCAGRRVDARDVKIVPGVTKRCARSIVGKVPPSAANTARSAQSKRGLGLALRSTVTSWRNTSGSTSLDADERPSNNSRFNSLRKIT